MPMHPEPDVSTFSDLEENLKTHFNGVAVSIVPAIKQSQNEYRNSVS
jgi:hypothetical protein